MNKLSAQEQKGQSELQALLNEETQRSTSLQLELDAKQSEIEHLRQKVALNAVDTSSVHSGNEPDLDDTVIGQCFSDSITTVCGA